MAEATAEKADEAVAGRAVVDEVVGEAATRRHEPVWDDV